MLGRSRAISSSADAAKPLKRCRSSASIKSSGVNSASLGGRSRRFTTLEGDGAYPYSTAETSAVSTVRLDIISVSLTSLTSVGDNSLGAVTRDSGSTYGLIGVAPARGSVRRAAFAPAAADAFDAAAPMVRELTTEELAWDGEEYDESTSIKFYFRVSKRLAHPLRRRAVRKLCVDKVSNKVAEFFIDYGLMHRRTQSHLIS